MQFEICDKCGINQTYGFFKNELLCDSCYKDEKAKLLVKHKINTSKGQRLYLIYHEVDTYSSSEDYLAAIFHNFENAVDYLMIKTGNYNIKLSRVQDGNTYGCVEPYVDIDDDDEIQIEREFHHWYRIVVMQSNDISEDSKLIRNILACKQ
jgi:hypothetical protein